MSVTNYALNFDRLAKFVGDLVPTGGTIRERFLQGVQPMMAQDVRIITVPGLTTYAQVVEKALTVESAKNKISGENVARRDSRSLGPPFAGFGRGGGPSDQKRKTPDTVSALGPHSRPCGIQIGFHGGARTEPSLSSSDRTSLHLFLSSFLEIAIGQTAETARQFLQATSWKLKEAIQLFYIGSEGGTVVGGSSSQFPPTENIEALAEQAVKAALYEAERNLAPIVGDEVRPPLPVIREALYDDALMYGASRMRNPSFESNSLIAFRYFDEKMKRPGVWESEQGVASTADNARDNLSNLGCYNLASLYRPPFHIMFQGSFEKAKGTASSLEKWLLVNLQSTKEFSSHMLNRDTWANEAVSQTISTNFVFWQVYDDTTEDIVLERGSGCFCQESCWICANQCGCWVSGVLDPEGSASGDVVTSVKRGIWAMIAVFLAYCLLQASSS
ncbi:plant UBX domain-containing protein 7-like [Humulus lupulus]|uniref:plant UBX domain-containing protein 7-like n=1 Tax=Humulus lupulus TaxID=3486 RepID=UPI002B40309B|nr:plant UBX domain-containing protein 7-like [Humulus lupulus]